MTARKTHSPIPGIVEMLVLLAVTLSLNAHVHTSRQSPNILFISADDLNDWTSILGGYKGKVYTPHMDRLARRGVTFTNAHCPSPVCNPSRTAIMTGLRPSTTGIYHNGQWWRPALPGVMTLPETLHVQGYEVVGGGKIFHHTLGNNPPDLWDHYQPQVQDSYWHYEFRYPGQHEAKRGLHWPQGFPLNQIANVARGVRPPNNYREFDWGPFEKADLDMGDGQAIAWAMDFLRQSHEKPFFLAVGTFRPHLPWYAPRRYFDLYPLSDIECPDIQHDDLKDVPEAGRRLAEQTLLDYQLVVQSGQYRAAVQAYLASISFVDALLGKLLDALDHSDHVNNTIIVFWSDHGWHLGEKNHWHKMTLWERATRVPLIIAAPECQSHATCARPVNLIDLYPTLIELCGLPEKEHLDGNSLKPLLENPNKKWHPTVTTLLKGNHAVRDERWRYIRYHDGSEELYDHSKDPHEWTNLASDPAYDSAKTELGRWIPKTDAPNAPVKSDWDFDPKAYTWKRRR